MHIFFPQRWEFMFNMSKLPWGFLLSRKIPSFFPHVHPHPLGFLGLSDKYLRLQWVGYQQCSLVLLCVNFLKSKACLS